jgi:SNF2 family DNA or RNA helicase
LINKNTSSCTKVDGFNGLFCKPYVADNTIDKFSELPIFINNDLLNRSIIPNNLNNIIIPNTFKLSLYDFQKISLAKMISLEKCEIQKIKYSYNMLFHNIKLIFDPFTNTKINKDLYFDVKTKGGILSDEMGLGKTITSIALILTNPAPNYLPNINTNNKINSKATLIICPSHLAKQWESEIKRCSNLSIITILTKTEYNHYIFNDFIKTDIIITSHQFIMNLKFYQALYYKQCTVTQYNASERLMYINRFLLTNLCELSFDEIKELNEPLFEFFNFHRIILDEGHEIFGGLLSTITLAKCISNWVASLDCNNYWYISGTPFINYNSVKNAADFIKLNLEDTERNIKFNYNSSLNYQNKNMENFIHKEYIWNNILEKICIRHRKCDIDNQINIPGYEEKIIWLNFTDIEKQLYNAKKTRSHDVYLQQLCCHPLIVETTKKIFGDVEVDLELMQDKLIEYHKKNYNTYKAKLEKLIPGKPEYHMLKKNFETQINDSHYLYSILEKMKQPEELNKLEEEICCICMDEFKIPAMTACGHIFCSYCLKESLLHKNECPMCKANLIGKEVFLINKKPKNDINPLISKYGSKLGKLILYIKSLIEIETSKIIIFSQWDDMLSLIGKTLLENNINNSFVKGNFGRRNSAITNFTKGSENKVIMLSLKNAASGTNLTNATHIFFVEPINASREEIKTIESQAIARACRIGQKDKVLIIRILIKDTIEEEIYNKNYI